MNTPNNDKAIVTSVYALRDNVAGIYLPPALGDSDAAMIREFGDVVNKPGSPLNAHPEDFVLCRIGTYDRVHGTLVACDVVILAHASDFVVNKEIK